MKRTLLFIAFVLASLAMSAQDSLAVEDVQNSDCLRKTRGEESEPLPTIVLTKEGSILSVQLLNYESVCGTSDFKVTPTVNDGKDGNPLSVSISVVPCIYGDDLPNCYCPYNVSFMVRDLEDNSFYLKCWWYEGLVTLEEGKPLVLEDITLNATIDGVNYTLKKTLGTATLTEVVEQKSEMIIPAELNYEGQAYAVKIITQTSFRDCSSIRKLDIPETVSTIYDYSFYGCKLDILIIRGFLEPHYINSNLLYGLGTDMKLYVQPSEVERYKAIYKGPVYPLPVNDPYRPLVEEGKHWTYDNFMPLRPAEYDHYYYYDLKGDTVIAGKNCFKMYSENQYNDNRVRYEGALYEENKKVYCFFPGKEGATLLYDFDCEVGDSIHNLYEASQAVVKDIRTVDNGGNDIKIYTIRPIMDDPDWGDEDDSLDFSWIEGVGAAQDFFNMMPASGNYCSLNACELNGEMLYQTIEPDLTAKGYHKMGIEGKRWNYIHYYFDEGGEHYDPYSYVVKGDTIIRHSTYKKLWYQDEKTERFVCFLRETGRTVYKNTDLGNNSYDSPIMSVFFEFSRDDFGRVFTWKAKNAPGNTNWMVYGVDTIEVKGQPFRRYTCLQKYSEEGETLTTIEYDGEDVWHDIWVEGVGSASSGIEDQILLHEPPEMPISDYTYFVSCYENGECIFTADDFNVQTKPVIDIAYRPFIEEGKVWKVGGVESRNPVRRVEYYYFDGDTIIGGKTCKQMMCQQYVNPDYADYDNVMKYPQLSYV